MKMRALFLSANNAMHFAWHDNNEVSAGNSRDHYSRRAPYRFEIQAFEGGIMPVKNLVSISSNDEMHFAWYIQRIPTGDPEFFLWVCAGPSRSLGTKRSWYQSSLARDVSPDNLLFITSNNDMHFAWFKKGNGELWVSRGISKDLDKHDVKQSLLPSGITADRICFMASNDDMHFAFLNNGTYIAGRSNKLGSVRSGISYDMAKLKG